MTPVPVEVRMDHPFLYLIRDTKARRYASSGSFCSGARNMAPSERRAAKSLSTGSVASSVMLAKVLRNAFTRGTLLPRVLKPDPAVLLSQIEEKVVVVSLVEDTEAR